MTNRDQIIEVMARGLALNRARQNIKMGLKDYGEDVTQKAVDATWSMWIEDAATAFDALTTAGFWIAPNEPTEGMIGKGNAVIGRHWYSTEANEIFCDMRDAFLRENEGK